MDTRYFVHMINISLKTIQEKLHYKLLQKLQIVKTVYKTPSVVQIRIPQYSAQQSAIKRYLSLKSAVHYLSTAGYQGRNQACALRISTEHLFCYYIVARRPVQDNTSIVRFCNKLNSRLTGTVTGNIKDTLTLCLVLRAIVWLLFVVVNGK